MNEWVDAEERIERAQQLCESQRYAEALDLIDQALEINPHNSAWWSHKAHLLDQLGRYGEALPAYREALQFDSQNKELMTSLGVDCIRTGQLLQALEVFESLARLDPDHEPAYCHRAMIYAELGEHDLAEQMFYLAQQINENCPHCFWNIGVSQWMRGQIRQAIYCWEKVLQIEPGYRSVRKKIAEAYRRKGEHGTALEYYLAEYREHPGDTELLLEMADLHLQNNQPLQTIEKCRHAIELDDQQLQAYVLLGDALGRIDEHEQALRAYQTAAHYDRECPGIHYKIGTKLMKLSRHVEAQRELQLELDSRPQDRATLMAAGNCALELHQPDQAQHCFERLIEIDDTLPGAYHNLAVCHFLRNEYDEGIQACESALSLKEDYTLARHKLILAHMHLGRWEKARQLLEEGLELEQDNLIFGELKRRWFYRRLSAWSRRLADTIKGLVSKAQNC